MELLLGSKRLGTAYSLVMGLPSYEAKPSTEMLSKMLDAAVEAKDRLRVGVRRGVNGRRRESRSC